MPRPGEEGRRRKVDQTVTEQRNRGPDDLMKMMKKKGREKKV
jgi:hypothetical protein